MSRITGRSNPDKPEFIAATLKHNHFEDSFNFSNFAAAKQKEMLFSFNCCFTPKRQMIPETGSGYLT